MQFSEAYELSKQIEQEDTRLIVVGFRRQRPMVPDSWAIDVMDRQTEKMATLDEKDDWQSRIAAIKDGS